ncbi:NOT2 / NOT3 / NOT5 family domain containing protein, partial [Elaphomyces granulatus]
LDRFRLVELLRMTTSENPDNPGPATGQDSTTDTNQPGPPLHPSPTDASTSAFPLDQDFTLPAEAAHDKVVNVPPLRLRLPGFGDETLFYIFYTMPQDIMQELAAKELYLRSWRYHLFEKAWVTRDDTSPPPVEVEKGVSERGIYLWWDAPGWRRIRVSDSLLRTLP